MSTLIDFSNRVIGEDIHKKRYIKDLSYKDLSDYLVSNGSERYRTDQIFYDVYRRKAKTFSDLQAIPKVIREKLEQDFYLYSIEISKIRKSSDGSVKFLFELNDGKSIETVYMPWTDEAGELQRSTICISSMAGCPVGCAFCATGSLGFKRNLSSAEIIDQILLVEAELDVKIDNIVIMGMGEPLLNYENVTKALNIILHEKAKIISRRKITLSTSGIAPRIKQLAKEPNPVKLAISLHATTNGDRNKIMPISQSFDLTKLMDAVEFYYRNTKMDITYEYILFDGLNDSDLDVDRLTKIARRVPSRVNIIPFNDISFTNPQGFSSTLVPAKREKIEDFASKLRKKGVAVIIRDSFGQDIEAACGQLALSEEQEAAV